MCAPRRSACDPSGLRVNVLISTVDRIVLTPCFPYQCLGLLPCACWFSTNLANRRWTAGLSCNHGMPAQPPECAGVATIHRVQPAVQKGSYTGSLAYTPPDKTLLMSQSPLVIVPMAPCCLIRRSLVDPFMVYRVIVVCVLAQPFAVHYGVGSTVGICLQQM